MRRKPRRTEAVRNGWGEIRAFISCELEAGQAHQFECREHNRQIQESADPHTPEPDHNTCPCEGCTATRNAWAAIAWIDARLPPAAEGGAS